MPNNILLVTSRPKSSEGDEEYNSWNNNFHLQQMLKLPGFVAATRYRLSNRQMEWFPPAAVVPQWPYGKTYPYLTIYEIDPSLAVDEIASRLTENGQNAADAPVEWGERWLFEAFTQRETTVWLRPEGLEPSKTDHMPNDIFVVPISPLQPELDQDFNRWYIAQANIRRPGFAAGTRYRLSFTQPAAPSNVKPDSTFGVHTYLMIYELYDPLAAYNDLRSSVERANSRSGEGRARYSWELPWAPLRIVNEHILYQPVTNRVKPIWLK